ncbi:MAG: Sapep family Mn(2+)-dependent dipeptidase [Oscillospiraceae bacterium]|nr:Sapep family Mn(2+)-dependent dipeptidase [Oscillospiraceae bacterium]
MDINLKDIDLFIEENKENILRDIGRLVAVPSIEGEPEDGAPFGREPEKALELGLEIAEEMGLGTRNCEHYIGYAELPGEDKEKYIATVTHLDVVPVGEGWTKSPFEMWEKDGYIIGRGVMDDKGPSVVCLYALKYLKEKNIPLRYTVRALLGANEETGMGDVQYYLKNYPAPAFAFSPDSNFPVCNGEKGIYQGMIRSKCSPEKIVSISGGMAFNVIPDKAEAVLKFEGEAPAPAENIEVSAKDGLLTVRAFGKSGHASMPEGTLNAIGVLVNYILDNGLCSEAEAGYLSVLKALHSASDGSGIGVAADDGKFSPLTIIGGIIGIKDGKFFQSLDSRYPTNTGGAQITDTINERYGEHCVCETIAEMEPFYIEPNSPEIQTCINTYNEITGEKAELYTMGGGTYARDFPNAVSFGPEHPERPMPEWVGAVHCVDEGASVEFLLEALKIYIVTLIRLQDVEL